MNIRLEHMEVLSIPNYLILKENGIHAVNWGFVAGKTNTMFPWSSWTTAYDSMSKTWHDSIYREDKSPFS